MNILKASYEIVRATPDGLDAIEEAARICYLSEPKDTLELREEFAESSGFGGVTFEQFVQEKFIASLIKRGHATPFEDMDITIHFICDRGVSHEQVRHKNICVTQ